MGVSAQTLTPAGATQVGLNVNSGALVVGVQPGSPAEAAGLAQGSAITSVGGTAVTSTTDLGTAIKSHKPGEKVAVKWVDRSGSHTSTVTLGGINP
jgi:S1-C subfamily serine protease